MSFAKIDDTTNISIIAKDYSLHYEFLSPRVLLSYHINDPTSCVFDLLYGIYLHDSTNIVLSKLQQQKIYNIRIFHKSFMEDPDKRRYVVVRLHNSSIVFQGVVLAVSSTYSGNRETLRVLCGGMLTLLIQSSLSKFSIVSDLLLVTPINMLAYMRRPHTAAAIIGYLQWSNLNPCIPDLVQRAKLSSLNDIATNLCIAYKQLTTLLKEKADKKYGKQWERLNLGFIEDLSLYIKSDYRPSLALTSMILNKKNDSQFIQTVCSTFLTGCMQTNVWQALRSTLVGDRLLTLKPCKPYTNSSKGGYYLIVPMVLPAKEILRLKPSYISKIYIKQHALVALSVGDLLMLGVLDRSTLNGVQANVQTLVLKYQYESIPLDLRKKIGFRTTFQTAPLWLFRLFDTAGVVSLDVYNKVVKAYGKSWLMLTSLSGMTGTILLIPSQLVFDYTIYLLIGKVFSFPDKESNAVYMAKCTGVTISLHAAEGVGDRHKTSIILSIAYIVRVGSIYDKLFMDTYNYIGVLYLTIKNRSKK